jgi:hypothetical protein
MRLLTSAPTTETPNAFRHQLDHCHCLFITQVSAEPRLPHLNNSSYRATTSSSRRSLLSKHARQAVVLSTLAILLSFTRLQTPTMTFTFSPSNPGHLGLNHLHVGQQDLYHLFLQPMDNSSNTISAITIKLLLTYSPPIST